MHTPGYRSWPVIPSCSSDISFRDWWSRVIRRSLSASARSMRVMTLCRRCSSKHSLQINDVHTLQYNSRSSPTSSVHTQQCKPRCCLSNANIDSWQVLSLFSVCPPVSRCWLPVRALFHVICLRFMRKSLVWYAVMPVSGMFMISRHSGHMNHNLAESVVCLLTYLSKHCKQKECKHGKVLAWWNSPMHSLQTKKSSYKRCGKSVTMVHEIGDFGFDMILLN